MYDLKQRVTKQRRLLLKLHFKGLWPVPRSFLYLSLQSKRQVIAVAAAELPHSHQSVTHGTQVMRFQVAEKRVVSARYKGGSI